MQESGRIMGNRPNDKRLTICCSELEAEKLRRLAEHNRMSITNYIKTLVNKDFPNTFEIRPHSSHAGGIAKAKKIREAKQQSRQSSPTILSPWEVPGYFQK